jgi:hypothetical protein
MPVRIRSVNLILGRRCIFSKILQRPTLVLNRNWQPVHVATVARALVMLWNESARVVDPSDYQTYTWEDWSKLRPAEGERFIRAVRFRLRVPEVITLTDYDRLPAATVSFSRRNIFKRDHYTCQYCGQQPGMEELTLDHVLGVCRTARDFAEVVDQVQFLARTLTLRRWSQTARQPAATRFQVGSTPTGVSRSESRLLAILRWVFWIQRRLPVRSTW